jgi:hypothetical protein
MARTEINLDGMETSILKAIGLGGSEITGEELMERVPDLVEAELIDAIKGLITVGYVVSDRQAFYDEEGLKLTNFSVNSGYAKDLKEAMDPRAGRDTKSKRVRRE